MNLDEAIQKHAEWKLRFRSAISRQESLDAATIGRDDRCQLGQWLQGEGGRLHAGRHEFQAVVARHRAFHVEAGKVATLINARRYDEATAAIGGGTTYSAASTEVGTALIGLKRVCACA